MGPKDPDAFEPLGLYDVRVESRPQEVRLVLLDGLNVVSHRGQDRHLLPIVHLALKQLQDLTQRLAPAGFYNLRVGDQRVPGDL